MRDLLTMLSPSGRTTKGHFGLIILGLILLTLTATSAKATVGMAAAIAVGVAIGLIVFVATIRRLHDAGRSRWWAILFFFPMDITIDLLRIHVSAGTWDVLNVFPLHVGEANWNLVDVRTVITLIPVFIGLLAASRPSTRQTTTPGNGAWGM